MATKIKEYGLPDYSESAEVTAARNMLSQTEASRPTAYQSQYQATIDNALKDIGNSKFTYNAAADPLYNQYKNYYTSAGKKAMKDTVGQIAAVSGGYGSSYAQTAGQAQYNSYMQQLANVLPQLEDRAYSRYRDTIADKKDNISALQTMENLAYSKYRDSVADWQSDRNYYYGKHADIKANDYAKYENALNYIASANSGAGGNVSVSDMNTIFDKCADYKNNDNQSGLKAYLNSLVSSGALTEDTAADLYEEYNPGQNTLKRITVAFPFKNPIKNLGG